MSHITVSIIDGNRLFRNLAGGWIRAGRNLALLSEHGNGQDALKYLPRPAPQVVLMDPMLPDMSGAECGRLLKLKLPKIQIVMLAASDDTQLVLDSLASGALGYLLKPIRRQDLLHAIYDVHAGGSPMTSTITRKVIQAFQPEEPPGQPFDTLSPRERQVLGLLARGFLYKEIAELLNLRIVTINAHIRHIYAKLKVRSRGQAVAKYLRQPMQSRSGQNS